MRPLIQYDLEEPPPALPAAPAAPHPVARGPPTKKRKRNHHNSQKHQLATTRKFPPQHWDDPGNTTDGMVYDEQGSSSAVTAAHVEDEEYNDEEVEEHETVDVYEDEEESRQLTHEEIWDDSALIDAWNAAESEYKAYHGTSKSWKSEPVKKSPLWYNKPYTAPPQPTPAKKRNAPQQEDAPEPDTAPLDFHTFVPAHDPSLAAANSTSNTAPMPFLVPPPSTTMVSRNDAFNNALSAMYWSGYWTAVYHCQSQTSGKDNDVPAEPTEEPEDEADEDEAEEDLVPAQR